MPERPAAKLRDDAPVFVAQTSKQASDAIQCIVPKWADLSMSSTVTPTEFGTSILVMGPPLLAILDISKAGEVKFYAAPSLFNRNVRMKGAIEACI